MQKPLFELRIDISNEDNFVSDTNKSVLQLLKYVFNDEGLEQCIDMVIGELLENVLEYNQWEETDIPPVFAMSIPPEKHVIVFHTSNPIEKGGEHHQAVLHSMKRLQEAKTPHDAAVERMVERGMSHGEDPRSHIGLFHIANGGFCQLEAHVDERSVLHVFATMRVNEILAYSSQSIAS